MKTRNIVRLIVILAAIVCLVILAGPKHNSRQSTARHDSPMLRKVSGTIRKGDTISQLFVRNKLHFADLKLAKDAADGVYDLGKLCSGHPYSITIDDEDRLSSLTYWIDDETYLNVSREGTSLAATLESLEYERRLVSFGGIVKDNLIASLGPGKDALLLALDLSDIFAWDIDFTADLRDGDTFRVVAEGLYIGDTFKKLGSILSAEFVNNGEKYRAYRFEEDGTVEYYDATGAPLKKAFLKAPLNFRRISSSYTAKRYHPILKRYTPHRGIDYAAAAGTPVSALGDGIIHFAGHRGGYGNLVILKHGKGYSTYYGHLSHIRKGLKNSTKVAQGDIIGYVGSTGLATGPHLHFEMRMAGKPINPFSVRIARKEPLRGGHKTRFGKFVTLMDHHLGAASVANVPPLSNVMAPKTQRKGIFVRFRTEGIEIPFPQRTVHVSEVK